MKKTLSKIPFTNLILFCIIASYDILQVNDLFKFHVACFVFKHVNNQVPPCFENVFLKTCKIGSRQTRQSNNLCLPLYKNLFANKLSHFLELKFGMICPKQPEA